MWRLVITKPHPHSNPPMKKNLLPAIAALVVVSCAQAQADTIADWTFETSQPTSKGPLLT